MPNLYNPGEQKPGTGTYVEVGPRGGKVPEAREVSSKKGEPLPPTQESGRKWRKKN